MCSNTKVFWHGSVENKLRFFGLSHGLKCLVGCLNEVARNASRFEAGMVFVCV